MMMVLLWSFFCIAIGAAAGWLVRSCTEVKSESSEPTAPPPPVPESDSSPAVAAPRREPVLPTSRTRALAHATQRRRRGFIDRDIHQTLWHTETDGTMLHTRQNRNGLNIRRKPLVGRKICSICCGGVEVVS